MKEKINKIRNTQNGITLVALVITIIVILLLSVVSINLIQNLGLIEKVKLAKEEHRASTIQEQKELFEKEIEISKYDGSTPKTINDLLNKLEEQKLITEEEKNTIMQTGRITIGSKEIVFDTIILPEGYTRCEYLESTETQHINIPIHRINIGYYAIVKFVSRSGKNYNTIIGSQSSGGYEFYTTNYQPKVWSSYIELTFVDGIDGFGEIRNAKVRWQKSVLNGLQLFAYNSSYKFNGRIYAFSFYDNNDLVLCNLIPCLDTNNRPCMYDTVSNKPFYNQGTGEFIAGSIVE